LSGKVQNPAQTVVGKTVQWFEQGGRNGTRRPWDFFLECDSMVIRGNGEILRRLGTVWAFHGDAGAVEVPVGS
jgi:hypothetical protein